LEKLNKIKQTVYYEQEEGNEMTKGEVIKTLLKVFYELTLMLKEKILSWIINKISQESMMEIIDYIISDLFYQMTKLKYD
jgi:hypothetical protein